MKKKIGYVKVKGEEYPVIVHDDGTWEPLRPWEVPWEAADDEHVLMDGELVRYELTVTDEEAI